MGWFRRFFISQYSLHGDTHSASIVTDNGMGYVTHGIIERCRDGWVATNARTDDSRDFETFRKAVDALCLELGFDPRELSWFVFRGEPERKSWGWPGTNNERTK